MDLALNNIQKLICNKTQKNKEHQPFFFLQGIIVSPLLKKKIMM